MGREDEYLAKRIERLERENAELREQNARLKVWRERAEMLEQEQRRTACR